MEDREAQLHRDLMQLPELNAPATLIPGVLSRLSAAAPAAWYQRAWWQWPIGLRIASGVCVIALLGALGWLGGSVGELGLGERLVDLVSASVAAGSGALDQITTLLGSGGAFWIKHGQMILIGAASLLLAAYLTCVAAGTALYRLAWRRIS